MKEHPCGLCGKIFDRKSNWIYHTQNKKHPCVNMALNNNNNTPLCIEIIKNKENEENKEKEENEIKRYPCEYCKKVFTRKYSLDRHLDGRCKLKLDIDIKQKQNMGLEVFEDKLNYVIKENQELKLKIEKLETKIKKNKKTTNINIGQQNININIVNFNDLDYNDMDKKLFTKPLLNSKLQGKFIILQMIENVYINDAHPEYQNIMVTDKNRGYVKIYNNGRWKTDNINTMNMVIDGIISHSKNILVELKQQYLNNAGAKSRLNTSEKYVSLCDLEYLGDLEDEQLNDDVNNDDRIKRCKDFREMVYKDTINLFHDNKNLLQKSKTNNQHLIQEID
jgi:hypothetical protein